MVADHPAGPGGPEGFIHAQVRRASRNLLVWNLVGLLALLAVAWFTRVYYDNFFFGPFPAGDDTLLDAARRPGNGELLRYVELNDRKLLPTGVVEVSTADDKPYSFIPYFMTPVGDRVMLVQAKSEAEGRHLVGPLFRVPGKVDREVIDVVVRQHPELRGRFLPVMLNAEAAFRVIGFVGLAAGLPAALLLGFNVGRALLRMADPRRHPVARDAEAEAAIDREVAAGPVERFGPATVTRSWLLRPTAFGLTAVRLGEVVWVYGLSVGGRHVAVIRLRSKKTAFVRLPRQALPAALRAVAARAPWALVGFDRQREQEWRRRPADVIAAVDAQRQRLVQPPGPGPGAPR